MALLIRNCLSTSSANFFVQNCCSSFACEIFNTDKADVTIDAFSLGFAGSTWIVNNIQINNNPVSIPFTISSLTSAVVSFEVCADSGSQDTLNFRLRDLSGNLYSYNFPCEAIGFSQITNMPVVVDFGSIPVNTSTVQNLSFNNIIAGCNNWNFYDCILPFSMTSSINVCNANGIQNIPITFAPTEVGLSQIYITVTFNDCASLLVLLNANAIAPETNGSSNGQKNKVDQTSVLPACSPRTINNQCNTGQAARGAIASRAQTITRPSGGAGRGKGFSK